LHSVCRQLLSFFHYFIISLFHSKLFWDILQTIGLLTSFLYLWLEFQQKASMWIVSACCSAIYASIYFHAKIYGDMSFSLFNICMCTYGFIKWMKSERTKGTLKQSYAPIVDSTAVQPSSTEGILQPEERSTAKRSTILYRHFRLGEFGVVMLVTAAIWGVLYMALRHLTDSPVPVLDAFTTTLNIVGTWVLAQKIIEVWGFWFLVNLLSIYLYCKRGLHFTTILLYSFYLCASVYGWWKWHRHGQCVEHPLKKK
jgi:nicotinamide mononucleotide transporter